VCPGTPEQAVAKYTSTKGLVKPFLIHVFSEMRPLQNLSCNTFNHVNSPHAKDGALMRRKFIKYS
jgi:hypothetical protein